MATGRDREAALVRKANRAAAVCRLMLGEMTDWRDFLEADSVDLASLPRRNLKRLVSDVRKRLSADLKRFSDKNFPGMTEAKLSRLYEAVKTRRGREMPLAEFEEKYASVGDKALAGAPRHATVHISLWGLQFQFPEDLLAKDTMTALSLAMDCEKSLKSFEALPQRELVKRKSEVQALVRQKDYAARTCVLCCFNLVEAYVNGLAWEYLREPGLADSLSNKKRDLLEDRRGVTFRDKLLKYPETISGRKLWTGNEELVSRFLEDVKPFRDSLVHPSPFSAPDRFGGHDKLRRLYRLDVSTAVDTAIITCEIIEAIQNHLGKGTTRWLSDLRDYLDRQQACYTDTKSFNEPA